jgi:hypothetical protein
MVILYKKSPIQEDLGVVEGVAEMGQAEAVTGKTIPQGMVEQRGLLTVGTWTHRILTIKKCGTDQKHRGLLARV